MARRPNRTDRIEPPAELGDRYRGLPKPPPPSHWGTWSFVAAVLAFVLLVAIVCLMGANLGAAGRLPSRIALIVNVLGYAAEGATALGLVLGVAGMLQKAHLKLYAILGLGLNALIALVLLSFPPHPPWR